MGAQRGYYSKNTSLEGTLLGWFWSVPPSEAEREDRQQYVIRPAAEDDAREVKLENQRKALEECRTALFLCERLRQANVGYQNLHKDAVVALCGNEHKMLMDAVSIATVRAEAAEKELTEHRETIGNVGHILGCAEETLPYAATRVVRERDEALAKLAKVEKACKRRWHGLADIAQLEREVNQASKRPRRGSTRWKRG